MTEWKCPDLTDKKITIQPLTFPKGPFIIDVTQKWPFSDPLAPPPLCHTLSWKVEPHKNDVTDRMNPPPPPLLYISFLN